ncbi:MAG TPA: S24 family peptidase [Allosphingosinicella sp.]|jgi:hypothetical protein
MNQIDQRAALQRLVRERGEDYAGLSRLIGRNPAYIQQFIKRGTPRRLSEGDRKRLAAYFDVDDSVLGGPPSTGVAKGGATLVPIQRLDVGASAGPGALSDGEHLISHIAFDRQWLKQLCGARPEDLSLIRVQGDSMFPTLSDGEEIMVDRSDGMNRLRDGIYVLLRDDELVVKRLAVNPVSRRLTLKSDNPAYPDWPDCRPEDIIVAGRVVWGARRIS